MTTIGLWLAMGLLASGCFAALAVAEQDMRHGQRGAALASCLVAAAFGATAIVCAQALRSLP